MAKIIAPNQQFTGKRAGVAFVDGKAESNDEGALRYFAKHGYTVEGQIEEQEKQEGDVAPVNTDPATDPLGSFTLEQLREYASDNGIDLGGATKKEDVRAAILRAGAPAES